MITSLSMVHFNTNAYYKVFLQYVFVDRFKENHLTTYNAVGRMRVFCLKVFRSALCVGLGKAECFGCYTFSLNL